MTSKLEMQYSDYKLDYRLTDAYEWAQGCLLPDPEHRELSATLWASYRAWCERNGEVLMGRRQFYAFLVKLGVTFTRGAQGQRVIEGLRLIPPTPAPGPAPAQPHSLRDINSP